MESSKVCPLCRKDLPHGPQRSYIEGLKILSSIYQSQAHFPLTGKLACSKNNVNDNRSSNDTDVCNEKVTSHPELYRFHRQVKNEVLPLIRYSAEEGYDEAQRMYGYLFREGLGVSESQEMAAQWFLKAANQGHQLSAMESIADCYFHGNGVCKDLKQAMYWHVKAALQGHVYSQSHLAHMYEGGLGTKRNITRAIEWYTKAANQGDEDSMTWGPFFWKDDLSAKFT